MSSHTRLLRREYTGNLSLKTTDHCRKASFLTKFSPKIPECLSETKRYIGGQFLLELNNIFSSAECVEVIKNAEKYIFENMNDKYRFGKQRKSSRLLALDRPLAENLWEDRIKDVLSKEMEMLGISKRPHGFDVTRGEWELHGLNEAMRINKYSGNKKEYFGPHKDAQFCPNGDERSIFTLLIYLNEDFKGGQTCFYFPKNPIQTAKGMTIKEEIDSHGGLKERYDCVKIVPKVGHAVISSQDILHESLPVVKGTKYILKSDVVVKRNLKQFGFAIDEREKVDYAACLNFFREAQQEELQGNFNVASDLYEKALSIRYCYPQCLEKHEDPTWPYMHVEEDILSVLPSDVWYHVFKYLSGYDAQNLVYAYPELNYVKAGWDQRQRKIACNLSNEKYLPKIKYQKGVITCFQFSDAEYFRENVSGCCRVAAMYSFFLLSHKPQDTVYTVRYNPDTQEVCAVALETLLSDVFHGRRCYGSFYNVRQQDPETKDPRKDFEASVDRSYMLMHHGVEFTGVELPDSFYVKSTCTVYPPLHEKYDESDDDSSDEESLDDTSDENECDGSDCGVFDDDGSDGGGKGRQEDFVVKSVNENDFYKEKENGNVIEMKDENHSVSKTGEEINGGFDVYCQKEGERSTREVLPNEEKKIMKQGDAEVSNENKKTREICNGLVPFYGEIDEIFPIDSLLRYLLISRDISRADLPQYDDEFQLYQDTLGVERINEITTYFDRLDEIQGDAHVSATRVSKLSESLNFQGNDICICYHGPEEKTMDYVADRCTTELFNHLVFDFQNSQLTVKYIDPNVAERFPDVVDKFYRDFIASEMAKLECSGESIVCKVNIESILSSDTSFNHASCQCGNPRLEVHEYYNLKDYPSIDDIYVAAKEKSGEMIVWTFYKGVVAL